MRRTEINWLPNLLTAGNLFLGFWAILLTFEQNYLAACWLIIAASICDALDGKLARIMKSSSEFGLELDSLADVVSFGAAPGVLLYAVSFSKFGWPGLLLSALPLMFGVMRLARFNCSTTLGEKKAFYVGLPIPIQANMIASFIIFNYALWGQGHLQLELLLIPMTLILAFLMVSHLPFEGLPRLDFHEMQKHPTKAVVTLAIVVLFSINPAITFFPLISLYILRRVLLTLMGLTPEEEELESEIEVEP